MYKSVSELSVGESFRFVQSKEIRKQEATKTRQQFNH